MTDCAAQRPFVLYWKLAFVGVVLAVFSEFLWKHRVTGEPWQVVVVFVLGALYVVLGVIDAEDFGLTTERGKAFALGLQCALATAMVLVTPLKGFSGLITMPAAAAAVMSLPWPWATLIVLELFGACLLGLGLAFGSGAALQSIPSYATAFAFTVVFSVVTRGAHDARERAESLSRELAGANEQLRRYAEQAEELATTRERNRLAREIHDGIGHYLTTINVQLEAARATFATHPEQASAALDHAARLSREALDEVRHSVGSLRADVARPPLPESLQTLARNLGLPATMQINGTPRPLPPAIEHALYRAAQEGLTNVRKHAGASHVGITLDFAAPDCVGLKVIDDGRGAGSDAPATGFGLRGLRERLELLRGRVSTANRPGGGFALSVEVPT